MRHSLQLRTGQASDAGRLAVLAAQVWLHTSATDGITDEIANYVLSEFTVDKFSAYLSARYPLSGCRIRRMPCWLRSSQIWRRMSIECWVGS